MTAPTCTNPFTVGICVVYMPVFAIMAVAGGTLHVVEEKSARELHEYAQKAMNGIFDSAAMQRGLLDQVLDYARTSSQRNFHAAGTASAETEPDARLEIAVTAVDGIDVQAGAFELLSTHYVLVLEARARLRVGNSVLQDRTYRYVSAPAIPEAWAADSGQRMRDEIAQGNAQFAEWIIDDFFRGRVAQDRLRAPQAVAPKTPFALFGPYTKSGYRHAASIETLQPTLAWRSVPADAVADPSLRHELRVYRAGKVGRHLWALSPEYARHDLMEPFHTLETALAPCAYYIWSARTVRPLAGESRVSEWWGIWLESMPEGLRQAEPRIDHDSVLKINAAAILDQRLANYGSALATPCTESQRGRAALQLGQAAPSPLAVPAAWPAGHDYANVLDATLVSKATVTTGLAGAAKGLELVIRIHNLSEENLPGFRIKVELRDASGNKLGAFGLESAALEAGEHRELRHTLYPVLFAGLSRLREIPLEALRAKFTFDPIETDAGPLPH